ncbi:Lipid-A-disaccharide synthase [hydrothermal vent metagenome]|uniref:lipid-A-disaccharide synthase n=1 Tax=hydrothermal vent metagenome TaxID=652676 RepID=A0A3B0SZE0_9ZZZZ
MTGATSARPLRIAIIAGEASGDHLGGPLMRELAMRLDGDVDFLGIGGTEMTAAGLTSIFPMSDIVVMGPLAILRRLPALRRRIVQAAEALVAWSPDVTVIIDCPEFSHRVASRLRARDPGLPIVDYVAPTVWAWRPWRAKSMRRYVDEVMAVLPFEPEVFARLGGPRCRYVGHSAGERPPADPKAVARLREQASAHGPVLVAMPGSRGNEITRLMTPFGEAVARLAALAPSLGVIMPVLPHTRPVIEEATAGWPVTPVFVTEETGRHAAMAAGDAAIVASGTATLEMALAGTPMVVGYRMEAISAVILRPLVSVQSMVLANLVHGSNAIPELFQNNCTGKKLADAVWPLLNDTPQRSAQMEALADIGARVRATGKPPSAAAADIVLQAAGRRKLLP